MEMKKAKLICPECGILCSIKDISLVRREYEDETRVQCNNVDCGFVGPTHHDKNKFESEDLYHEFIQDVFNFMYPSIDSISIINQLSRSNSGRIFVNKKNRNVYTAHGNFIMDCDNGSEGQFRIYYRRGNGLYDRNVIEFYKKFFEVTGDNLTMVEMSDEQAQHFVRMYRYYDSKNDKFIKLGETDNNRLVEV